MTLKTKLKNIERKKSVFYKKRERESWREKGFVYLGLLVFFPFFF